MERLENGHSILRSFITAFEHSTQSEQALRDQIELCDKISKMYNVPEPSIYLIARKLQQTDELLPVRFELELQHEKYKIDDLKYDLKCTCNEVKGITIWERSCDVKSKEFPIVQCRLHIADAKREAIKLFEQLNSELQKYGKYIDVQVKIALQDLYDKRRVQDES